VTIFPKKGICIGFSWRHVVGDASTMLGFTKAWASIYKHGSGLALDALPSYDRSLLPDSKRVCHTIKIQQESWLGVKDSETSKVDFTNTPNDMVRSLFILNRTDIQNLKTVLLTKHPRLGHVSSFVVTVGYIWSCIAKMRAHFGKEKSEDLYDYFGCAAECRSRLDPSLPKTYFGNCVAPCFTKIKSSELLGEEGFINGAKIVGEAIAKFVHSESGLLIKDAENWMPTFLKMDFERFLSISGSPKFSRYDVDFGWGKPEKVDTGFNVGALSIEQSPDSEGGLEIGLCLPKHKMEAFTHIFKDNLYA
jgi:anthocyanin 5-O-glucoside-6'''-O-malonyltransferase